MVVMRVCDCCGKEFKTYSCYDKRNRKHRFCGKDCEAEFQRLHNTRENWRGGHIGKTTGYMYIRIDGKDVGEHILVAEKKIGRRLRDTEVVHHVDGNKLNNNPENLVVMERCEHQRLHASKRRNTNPCKRCGRVKTIHGRGLCGTCYTDEFKRGDIARWPLSTIPRKSQI